MNTTFSISTLGGPSSELDNRKDFLSTMASLASKSGYKLHLTNTVKNPHWGYYSYFYISISAEDKLIWIGVNRPKGVSFGSITNLGMWSAASLALTNMVTPEGTKLSAKVTMDGISSDIAKVLRKTIDQISSVAIENGDQEISIGEYLKCSALKNRTLRNPQGVLESFLSLKGALSVTFMHGAYAEKLSHKPYGGLVTPSALRLISEEVISDIFGCAKDELMEQISESKSKYSFKPGELVATIDSKFVQEEKLAEIIDMRSQLLLRILSKLPEKHQVSCVGLITRCEESLYFISHPEKTASSADVFLVYNLETKEATLVEISFKDFELTIKRL